MFNRDMSKLAVFFNFMAKKRLKAIKYMISSAVHYWFIMAKCVNGYNIIYSFVPSRMQEDYYSIVKIMIRFEKEEI